MHFGHHLSVDPGHVCHKLQRVGRGPAVWEEIVECRLRDAQGDVARNDILAAPQGDCGRSFWMQERILAIDDPIPLHFDCSIVHLNLVQNNRVGRKIAHVHVHRRSGLMVCAIRMHRLRRTKRTVQDGLPFG